MELRKLPLLNRFYGEWTTDVILFAKRGKTYAPIPTKGRYSETKSGKRVYELKGQGETKPVPLEKISRKPDGTPFLIVVEEKRNTYVPRSPEDLLENEEIDISGDLQQLFQWKTAEYRRIDDMHDKSPWYERYQPYIAMGITAMVVIVSMYLSTSSMEGAATKFVQGMSQVEQGNAPGILIAARLGAGSVRQRVREAVR